MEFVSCFEGSDAAEVVLCRIRFLNKELPTSAETLQELSIDGLVVSEGTEIHTRCDFHMNDLQVFGGGQIQEYVWYELLRQLTGHKIFMQSMGDQVQFTQWVCHAPENGQWCLVMELKSQGIIQKVAQLDLLPVENGELDLFQMANKLFLDCCSCNDVLRTLQKRQGDLQAQIDELLVERKLLDELLEQRDAKTRSIVVGLLNEKKRKIADLQRQLGNQDAVDSEIINRHVRPPVSGHGSHEKRHRPPMQTKKENKRQLIKREEEERSLDDFDDFEFLGIQKQGPVKQQVAEEASDPGTNSEERSTEQETDVEQETDLEEQETDVE